MRNMTKRQLRQYQEYQRVYRNAKAKERRLKRNHGVEVDFKLLTPTEWKKSPNKKREIDKLERFTDRTNERWQFVNLGRESLSARQYRRLAQENQRLIDNINYHKKKTLKRVSDLPYLVYDPSNEEVLKSNQRIEQRINELQKNAMRNARNRSMEQGTKEGLKRYNKYLKERLKRLQENRYAQNQKENYVRKLEDWQMMFKNTQYEKEYAEFLSKMKSLSPEDYEAFYYLSDMGSMDAVRYVNAAETGTPEGQEKIYSNMKAVRKAWQEVEKLLSL